MAPPYARLLIVLGLAACWSLRGVKGDDGTPPMHEAHAPLFRLGSGAASAPLLFKTESVENGLGGMPSTFTNPLKTTSLQKKADMILTPVIWGGP